MALISAARHVPQHADPAVPPQAGPGSGYVGRRRIPEPDWLTALATEVMNDARRGAAVGAFADSGRR